MQQPSLGRQNAKILNFELFTQICPQLLYATAKDLVGKMSKFYFLLFNQICPKLGYAITDP